MNDPVKPKIKFNHHTLTTTFLEARHLKELKNNLKSLGTKNKQLNHYLLTTYRIINDLESAQAEHRRRPKHARAADKDYVNTVEFVRLVAEIVAGHILNAVCRGREDTPKADDDNGLAKRLLDEFSSHTGTADGGASEHYTHGDHIRLGVANAVAEILSTAKATGSLPEVVHAMKTTALSAEAEAERRRRGALAARSLAAGKFDYNYCDSGKSNPRAQASRNKKFPKFEARKSNHRSTGAAAADERRTSPDGIASGTNSKAVSKFPGRSKPNISLSGGKDRGSASARDVARRVQIEKTVGSRTGQRRPANVIRNSYASRVPDARKTVGESHVSSEGKNVGTAVKSRDRMPRQPVVGDDAINDSRSRQQGGAVRGRVTIRLPKDASRRKQATAGVSKAGPLVRMGTAESKSNAADPPTSNATNSKIRWTATKDDRKKFVDPVPATTSNKIRKSGPAGVLPRELGTSGPRRKPTLADAEGRDKKHGNSLNSKRTVLGNSGVVEKSKIPAKRNEDADTMEKSKNSGTRNNDAAVEKSKILKPRHDDAVVKKSKTSAIRNGDAVAEKSKTSRIRNGNAVVEKPKTNETRNGGATVEKSKTSITKNGDAVVDKPNNTRTGNDVGKPGRGGKMNVTTPPSETLMLPAINYHEDASLTAARDGINEPIETNRTAAETIGGPRVPADERDDGGGKNALNRSTKKDRDFDEQDPVNTNGDLVENRRDRVENGADRPTTVAYNGKTGAGNAETEANNTEIGQNNVETGRDRVDERNQEETGQKTTTSMAADGANSRDTDDVCNDDSDDTYKLRKPCVSGLLDQCQNQHTGLYQAKKIRSKYEVTNLTKEEYCKNTLKK